MDQTQSELDRIRAVYRARDSAGSSSAGSPSAPWQTRGYRFYMQGLEWELLEALKLTGAPLQGGRVLEVGCGSGYFLHRFLEYGAAHGTGIDLMPERIEQASRRYPTLELVAGDAGALPWNDASFDIVSQFTCLSSVLDDGLRCRIASEMWRVLRPGGVVVSFDMRLTPAPVRLLRRLLARRATAAPATPTAPVELDELRRLFPDGELHARAVCLALNLAPLVTRSRWFAWAAETVPMLRTHLLVTVRKPK